MKEITALNVDFYFAGFPEKTKERLIELLEIIRKAAPKAEEVISYQMPAIKFMECWLTLQDIKITSGFILPVQKLKILNIN